MNEERLRKMIRIFLNILIPQSPRPHFPESKEQKNPSEKITEKGV